MKLYLSLKAEYFEAIKAGKKTEEYREATEYWTNRLCDPWFGDSLIHKEFDGIVLTLGYPKAGDPERTLELPWRGFMRKTITHPHFGPEPVEVFAIDVAALVAQGDQP
ncbi:ASCH domain-containing protein [Ensifer sp. 1H6]|uniref:ASCH domain-containing protein n=1 Tax=Ensifer sp. 1H6 TaxID=1911585 RepID=UPI0009D38811|nr:ASCH domain-containing protein [Ensifer sp. 1H6]OMQ44732.1 RNA-binding protein [Ensifer sp. 1H6]